MSGAGVWPSLNSTPVRQGITSWGLKLHLPGGAIEERGGSSGSRPRQGCGWEVVGDGSNAKHPGTACKETEGGTDQGNFEAGPFL